PAADGEDAHDADLQRDHRARDQADREVERQGRLDLAAFAGRGQAHARPCQERKGRRGFLSSRGSGTGSGRARGLQVVHLLWVPAITSPSILVKGTKGTILPL